MRRPFTAAGFAAIALALARTLGPFPSHAEMELAPPPRADFERATPEIAEPEMAPPPQPDYEPADVEMAPPPQADYEEAHPEMAEPEAADWEPATPDIDNGADIDNGEVAE